MTLQALTPFYPSRLFQAPSSDPNGPRRLDTQVGAIAISNDLTGQLTVTTAEGDKVTLSAALAEDFRRVTYRGATRQDGTSVLVSGQQTEYSLSRQLGVAVEGDLSEQEVKDLSKLFRKVLNIFRKFFNGQGEVTLAKSARLADRFENFSTLSSLDLSVEVERSVAIVAAQVASKIDSIAGEPLQSSPTSLSTSPETTGAASSVVAATPQPSTGTTAPTQPSVDSVTARDPADLRFATPVSQGKRPASLVDQVLDALKDSNGEPRKLRRYLPRLLDQVREEFQKELRGRIDGERTLPSDGTAQTESAIVLAYRSFQQTSLTLSVHS